MRRGATSAHTQLGGLMTSTSPGQGPVDQNAANLAFIAEFRANGGRAEGTALLHTTGARTGIERVNPMRMFIEGDNRYVFATNGGLPSQPDWFHNLVAHRDVTVEYDGEVYAATAVALEGDEDV